MKTKVYIAAPYTHGDAVLNVRKAIETADELAIRGFTPFVPHLTHFWHLVLPHKIKFWYALDNEWLAACDVVLRLPGESFGANAEVQLAWALGKRVYFGMDELISGEIENCLT
ncbi:MAG: DUF4406 domain-containing protein [Planctomycetota bacterium]